MKKLCIFFECTIGHVEKEITYCAHCNTKNLLRQATATGDCLYNMFSIIRI